MIKVEAVVIRERVETVIDAVEEETGHVGVTVVEAIGHGRQRGVTHEYRGRVFESRFLPKAVLTFIVDDDLAPAVVDAISDAARSGNESGDGLVFGAGNGLLGLHGFAPSSDALLAVGKAPYSFFSTIPGASAYLFEVVFAGVSLAIVWGAMAERARLWVYFVFGVAFTLIYSVVSHWIWHSGGWLFGLGMQDFAGSTVVHYQGALAALAGAILLGPRIGTFGHDGRANPVPGPNVPHAAVGPPIHWFR